MNLYSFITYTDVPFSYLAHFNFATPFDWFTFHRDLPPKRLIISSLLRLRPLASFTSSSPHPATSSTFVNDFSPYHPSLNWLRANFIILREPHLYKFSAKSSACVARLAPLRLATSLSYFALLFTLFRSCPERNRTVLCRHYWYCLSIVSSASASPLTSVFVQGSHQTLSRSIMFFWGSHSIKTSCGVFSNPISVKKYFSYLFRNAS